MIHAKSISSQKLSFLLRVFITMEFKMLTTANPSYRGQASISFKNGWYSEGLVGTFIDRERGIIGRARCDDRLGQANLPCVVRLCSTHNVLVVGNTAIEASLSSVSRTLSLATIEHCYKYGRECCQILLFRPQTVYGNSLCFQNLQRMSRSIHDIVILGRRITRGENRYNA
jgi:hypothetical protein